MGIGRRGNANNRGGNGSPEDGSVGSHDSGGSGGVSRTRRRRSRALPKPKQELSEIYIRSAKFLKAKHVIIILLSNECF